MSDYIGARCPVCHKKFTAKDEIVVCPTCGAPHHKQCYEQLGHCTFEQDHITGCVWKNTPESTCQPPDNTNAPPNNTNQSVPPRFNPNQPPNGGWFGVDMPNQNSGNPEQNFQICNYCGAKNPKDNLFCLRCGKKLSPSTDSSPFPRGYDARVGAQFQYNPVFALYGGLSPEEKIGDFSVRDTASFIGPSSGYYLPRFKTFQEDNKFITLNFSSFFFGFFYFFYRKMYLPGIIMLVAFILSSIPSVLMMQDYLPYLVQTAAVETAATTDQATGSNEYLDSLLSAPYNETRMNYYSNLSNSIGAIYTIIKLVVAMLSNRLYYEHTMKKMKKVKAQHPDIQTQESHQKYTSALMKAGGVNKPIVVVSVVLVYAAYFASLMFFL